KEFVMPDEVQPDLDGLLRRLVALEQRLDHVEAALQGRSVSPEPSNKIETRQPGPEVKLREATARLRPVEEILTVLPVDEPAPPRPAPKATPSRSLAPTAVLRPPP